MKDPIHECQFYLNLFMKDPTHECQFYPSPFMKDPIHEWQFYLSPFIEDPIHGLLFYSVYKLCDQDPPAPLPRPHQWSSVLVCAKPLVAVTLVRDHLTSRPHLFTPYLFITALVTEGPTSKHSSVCLHSCVNPLMMVAL